MILEQTLDLDLGAETLMEMCDQPKLKDAPLAIYERDVSAT